MRGHFLNYPWRGPPSAHGSPSACAKPDSRPQKSPNTRTSPECLPRTRRANPFPKVTDPVCRLPSPTFFYQPEAPHLGDLLRLSVRRAPRSRRSVARPSTPFASSRDVASSPEGERNASPPCTSPITPPLRPNRFRGLRALDQRRNLCPGLTPSAAKGTFFKLRCRLPGSRDALLKRVPPAARGQELSPASLSTSLASARHSFATPQSLRSASPSAQCASRGTLLHIGLQGFRLNTCYSHQDLHYRPFHYASRL